MCSSDLVEEFAPCVRPTGRQHDIATLGQPLESGITINLQDAVECFEVRGGSLRLAIGTVEVDDCRWIGPAPRPIVARINPQSARLGAATAGIQHRNWGVIGEDFVRNVLRPVDGYIALPDGPGLGLSVDEKAVRAAKGKQFPARTFRSLTDEDP